MAPTACAHQVFYFDAVEPHAVTLASFFASPLLRGEAVVVVATPEHRERVAEALVAAGVDLDRARAEHRYDDRDAATTLASLTDPDGSLSAERFEVLVTRPLVDMVERFGAVTVYGEMVGLLASRGHLVASLELEQLWLAPLETLPLRLLCGYPDAAVPDVDRASVDALHDSHAFCPTSTAAVDLPLDASAGPVARQAVLDACTGWGLVEGEWVDDAALVVSELVGNAVRHGGSGIVLQVDQDHGALRVSVSDSSEDLPQPRDSGDYAEDGRGLMIVGALAESWGVEPRPSGKVVWANLRPCPMAA